MNSTFFKQLQYINDSAFEVEHVKVKAEHREPIVEGFFILQYAKLRILEFYYSSFKQYCDESNFEELEMDTDSPCSPLAENDNTDCIRQDHRGEWSAVRSEICRNTFEADSLRNFFPQTCCSTHSQLDKREPGLVEKKLRATKMICLCSKTYCCFDSQTKKTKFNSKGFNKHFLMSHQKVLFRNTKKF